MIRLQEFITKIRNCKTAAEERAEYQREMFAIRESFSKSEETLRPRNVTKLLFINMSGQETDFGQMQCLNLIAAPSLIEKRIGYLGLTQLFHEKSSLLMMSTNSLHIDLTSTNNNLVALTLCVLSEICTVELSRELYLDVLRCISGSSSYIRKKAIATAIRVIKKTPEYINEFLPKVINALEEKSHGVVLAAVAFLQNTLHINPTFAPQLMDAMTKLIRTFRLVAQDHTPDYTINGMQDPFLFVAMLRFMRLFKRHLKQKIEDAEAEGNEALVKDRRINDAKFQTILTEAIVIIRDSAPMRTPGVPKNGVSAVLLQAFQASLLLSPTPASKMYVTFILDKFISVKDANTKYLSLFALKLMTHYDMSYVNVHTDDIFECLTENDILIQTMAINMLYLIADANNSSDIAKRLLQKLYLASDEEYIEEIAYKICMIVEKHSESRRYHFDTILNVLILADQFVRQDSAKSLIHLVSATPQLQEYCLAKLFFMTTERPHNEALCKITLYLIGEFTHILLGLSFTRITDNDILNLIEGIMMRVGVRSDPLSYSLSALFKLYQKFPAQQKRIHTTLSAFTSHDDFEVEKRACEYIKLLQPQWDADRKKEICIPIPIFKQKADAFKSIPIGNTHFDLDVSKLAMPTKVIIENIRPKPDSLKQMSPKKQSQPPVFEREEPKPKQIQDTEDLFNILDGPPILNPYSGTQKFANESYTPAPKQEQPFDFMNLMPTVTTTAPPPTMAPLPQNNSNLMGFEFNLNPTPPSQPQYDNRPFTFEPPRMNTATIPTSNNTAFDPMATNMGLNMGINLNVNPTPINTAQVSAPKQAVNPNLVLALENDHIQMHFECVRVNAETTQLHTTYNNRSNGVISELAFQGAVAKFAKMSIEPMDSNRLNPTGVVRQTITVTNTSGGQKAMMMKIKLMYTINGQKMVLEDKFANFPKGV